MFVIEKKNLLVSSGQHLYKYIKNQYQQIKIGLLKRLNRNEAVNVMKC